MPKVVVIAGPNGAGKSTTAPAILRDALEVHEFVNADTIATGLSAFSPESVALAASRTFARWIKRLQAEGYTFHLVYLCLPTVGLAVERVAERVRRGGHAVPEDVVRRRYARSLDNFFSLYTRFANTWVMVDNSVRSQPRMIARGSAGRVVSIFYAEQWTAFQAQL
jgi:predicted ABC-type ATPase